MGLKGYKRGDWSDEELQIIKDNYLKMSDDEMASMMDRRSGRAVNYKRQCMGLFRPRSKYSFSEVIPIMESKGYILLSDESEYSDTHSPIRYICPKHRDKGVLEATLGHLLEGKGCRFCGYEATAQKELIPEEKLKEVCDEKGLIYKERVMIPKNQKGERGSGVKFICKRHPLAGIQQMTYFDLLRDTTIGCKYCGKQYKNFFKSADVKRIKQYLEEKNIDYIMEYEFEGCRDERPLPFDFYLPLYNCCIEYDGEHHFRPMAFGHQEKEITLAKFEMIKKHEKMRDKYCEDNNIPLLRIPFKESKNLLNILETWLKEQGILQAV